MHKHKPYWTEWTMNEMELELKKNENTSSLKPQWMNEWRQPLLEPNIWRVYILVTKLGPQGSYTLMVIIIINFFFCQIV